MSARSTLVWIAVAALTFLAPLAAAPQSCTVTSGVDVVTGIAHSGAVPLGAPDFAAAAAGAAAPTVVPNPSWATALPCTPQSSWIGIPAGAGGSGLLSVQFPCALPPCSNASLTICFAVDNDLGTTVNEGLFMNGSPIPGSRLLGGLGSNYAVPNTWTLNVGGLVHGGTNRLELLVRNYGGPSGIRFSATLSLGLYFPVPLCTTVGPTPQVVPTMSGANVLDPLQRNDDGSSGPIPLGFQFCFFGQVYDSVYINNNGNVTFGAPFGAFTGTAFPTAGPAMIAPFWADVDTRNTNSGHVWFLSFPTRMVITWENVGYYDQHADKLNSFQLMLSNGNDPVVGIGNNVCFCYACMEWTTGDASQGANGFGGAPAIVGINRGDGATAIEVGRFDHAGTDNDGTSGTNDGVSWLDRRVLCFDLGTCCGQVGQPGINDLTVNGQTSGSASGTQVVVPVNGSVTFSVSTWPGSFVTLMYAAECHCPGLVTPFGELHLDLPTLAPLVDGCGIFGPQDPLGWTSTGTMSVTYVIPPTLTGLCVCVQALVCHPGLLPVFTQSYQVCFL